jgi:hypothetical protein
MSKSDKSYAFLENKDAAQRRILSRIEGLPPEEQIAVVRREVEKTSLGKWWLSLPKDPGPRPQISSSGGESEKSR